MAELKSTEARWTSKAAIRDQLLAVQKAYNATITALNAAAKAVEPDFEPVIVGQAHRAAGLLVWDVGEDGIVQVLLAKEAEEFVIPGGKAIAEEHPMETAIREFSQELGGYYETKTLATLLGGIHSSLYYPQGKYTLFIVHARFLGTPLKSLPWYAWTSVPTLKLHPFARIILNLPAMATWACTARLLK